MTKAFALAGGRLGLPRRRAGGRRRGAHRAAALPPVGDHPGGRAGGAGAHATNCSARSHVLRAERDRTVEWLRGIGLRGRRLRRELRAVRYVRRPARGLAGAARPRCADPGDWPGRLAARVHRHAGRDGSVSARLTTCGGGTAHEPSTGPQSSGRPRRPRFSSRSTSTAPATPMSAPGSGSTTTCSPRSASTACSTSPCTSRATCTSTRTTPSRTPRSRSARRSREAPATRPAPAASVTRSSRWTRRSCRPRSTCPAGPTSCTTSPTARRRPIGPDYATTLTRHVFESFVYHAAIALHVNVLSGRDWHHVTEAQYKAVARALRDAVELDPRVQRRAVDQGRAVAADETRCRARLRVGQSSLCPAGAGTRRRRR